MLFYKKGEINTHFLIHTHGSRLPLPQLDPAGEDTVMQASKTHWLPREDMKIPHPTLAVSSLKLVIKPTEASTSVTAGLVGPAGVGRQHAVGWRVLWCVLTGGILA